MTKRLNPGRLRSLVSGPGVDTRYHIVEAVVDAVRVDPNEGVFCDVSFLPMEEPETALLGVPYAGANFGFYFPVEEDDIVLVAIPNGDAGAGPVIIARMWSAADPPFSEMQGSADSQNPGQFLHSRDVVLKVASGANSKRLVSGGGSDQLTVSGGGGATVEVSGGGDIELTAAGSGVVKLQDASQSFVRGNDFDAQLDSFLTAQTTFITALAAAVSAISVYANSIAQPAVLPTTAPANATLQTALVTTFAPQVALFNAALADFQSSSSLWLSTRVKGQ